MSRWIYKHDVEIWWRKGCDYFVQQEAEMRQKNPLVVREDIFYAEPNDDQYEIFWVEFPIKLAKWFMHLQ